MERTASVTLSKHGCRYPSRFDYGVGTSVTLQLMGSISGTEKPQTVRAIVRSIHPPASLRELQQVGVELEIPANVWGIAPAPADWSGEVKPNVSTPQLPAVAASPPQPGTKMAGLGKVVTEVVAGNPVPKTQDTTSSPLTSQPGTAVPQVPATPAKRVVVTPDELISALQGKLQHEAEKAVQAALAKQVNDRIQDALRSIDDARELSRRELYQLIPAQVEEVKRSLKEEFAAQLAAQRKAEIEASRRQAEKIATRLEAQAGDLRRELADAAQEYAEKMTREIATQIPPRMAEAVRQATSDFESQTAAAVDRGSEQLLNQVQTATQEALSNLNARSVELLALSQNALTSGLDEFRRQTDRYAQMALAETQERAVSALGSLDAESRAACDARRQALESDVSRSGELAVEEFRKGMKVFLYSCLVAAVDAVDEHSKTTRNELLKANERQHGKSLAGSEGEIAPTAGNDLLTH